MEIEFNNLVIDSLNGINLKINNGDIVSFIGEELEILNNLFNLSRRPQKGKVMFNGTAFDHSSHIDNIERITNKIEVVSSVNISNDILVEDYIKQKIKDKNVNFKNINKRIEESLNIVNLDVKLLKRKMSELSSNEYKLVLLGASLACNPDLIIINSLFNNMIYKEQEYFKKLFLKISKKFKKTIILVNEDISFIMNLVNKIFVINKGKIVYTGNKDSFYDSELYRYVDIPKIIEFTNYVNSLGHNILQYTEFNELIKEIYRNVKEKRD